MDFIWDENKNRTLRERRGISFEAISALIKNGEYVEILQNPRRPNQKIFLVPYRGHINVVPVVTHEKGNIILKTVFPSRKFDQL
jgi:uncharacterized DUF497 family protein